MATDLEGAVAGGEAEPRPAAPRPALPLRPLAFALGLFAAIAAAYLAWHALFDSLAWMFDASRPLGITSHNRIHLVVAALIAFLVTTLRHEQYAWPRDVSRVWELTGRPPQELADLVGDPRVHTARVRASMVVGGLVGLLVLSLTSRDSLLLFHPRSWNAHFLWNLVTTLGMLALMGRVAFETFASHQVTRRITRAIPALDLLDRRALAPFAAIGLRHAFYWVLGTSIASILVLDLAHAWPLVPLLALTLAFATTAFLGPALAIRDRVRAEKGAELARVRASIEAARDAALAARPDASAAASLPGLLAWEARVDSVREWPFELPELLRFGALLLLAAGSWLGGALVERLLGSVLD